MKLAPGSYMLSRDVVNPTPDRRHKHDWRMRPVWRAGMELVVREERAAPLLDEAWLASLTEEHRRAVIARVNETHGLLIEAVGDRWPSLHRIGEGNEAYAALAVAMVPIAEESLEAFLARIQCESALGRYLVESGRMTRDQLAELWAAYERGDGVEVT